MIQPNKLRIGNLVYLKYADYPNPIVHTIDGFDIFAIEGKKLRKRGVKILPIPLSENILLNVGFVKIVHDSTKEEYWHRRFIGEITEYCPSITIWKNLTRVEKFSIGEHLEFVHQLQNLYFTLTSKELEINL